MKNLKVILNVLTIWMLSSLSFICVQAQINGQFKEVKVFAKDSAFKAEYRRTKYFVKEVYVYSMLATQMIKEVDDSLANVKSKKLKRKYISESYKALKKEFSGEISQMSITRGRYLMKILHRETGKTAYDIIKQYKGVLTAKTWESVLKLNQTTLKTTFDPDEEDAVLDYVLSEVEYGAIKPKKRPPLTERGKKAAKIRKKKFRAKMKQLRKKKKLSKSKKNLAFRN